MVKAPVVLVTFAGRRDRMVVLQRYAEAAMRRGLIDEWHIWNFTRSPEDEAWLRANFPSVRRTADDRIYRPVSGARIEAVDRHVLQFQVRAGHDAHVALLAEGGGASYELVLGGWGNSSVGLRVLPPGGRPDHPAPPSPPHLLQPAPALLSRRAWRDVAVEMNRADGRLCIAVRVEGREVLRSELIEPIASGFDVAVMSGYGAEAEWRFPEGGTSGAGLFEATRQSSGHQWNPVYHHYADRADEYADTVFLKCDDDIVYLDLDRLGDFIRFRCDHPEYFLVSANVVNNGVCANVQQRLGTPTWTWRRCCGPIMFWRMVNWRSGMRRRGPP